MTAFDTDKFRKSIDYIKEHGGSFRITNAINAKFLWNEKCKNYQINFPSGFVILFDDFMASDHDTITFHRWKKVDGKYHQIITCVMTVYQDLSYVIGNIEVEI